MRQRIQFHLSTIVFALPLTIGVGSACAAWWYPDVMAVPRLTPAAKLVLIAGIFLAPSLACFAGARFAEGLRGAKNVRAFIAVAAGLLFGMFAFWVATSIVFAIAVYNTYG